MTLINTTNSYLRQAQMEMQNIRIELEKEKNRTEELENWKFQTQAEALRTGQGNEPGMKIFLNGGSRASS